MPPDDTECHGREHELHDDEDDDEKKNTRRRMREHELCTDIIRIRGRQFTVRLRFGKKREERP